MSITTNDRWTSVFHVIAELNETFFCRVHCLLFPKSRSRALMHLGSGPIMKSACRCLLEIDGSVKYKVPDLGGMVDG